MSTSRTAQNPSKSASPNDQPWAQKLRRVHDKRYLLLRMAVGRVLADSVWHTYRYGYLIHRNHALNEAWPGNARVAANIGKSVRTVQRHKQLPGYNGFCGSCSTPFMEPATSKFSETVVKILGHVYPLRALCKAAVVWARLSARDSRIMSRAIRPSKQTWLRTRYTLFCILR